MNKLIVSAGVMLNLTAAMAEYPKYKAHVTAVIESRPNDGLWINEIEAISRDYILHYEKAIRFGTTQEYEEGALIHGFDRTLQQADLKCRTESIQLENCIEALICNKQLDLNLFNDWLQCE